MALDKDSRAPTGAGRSRAAAEARLGYLIAGHLNARSEELPDGVAERLKSIRQMVVDRRSPQRAIAAVPVRRLAAAGAGSGGGEGSWRLRLGLLLAVPTLLYGLYALQHFEQERFVKRIADIDTALLLDDLPPQAYLDPGFRTYLQQGD
ncbi:hypothetical protein GALL_303430 [mine drainage metagenome]|jgi:hypothetical protein|uniref:Uncharacterized protein n=1 Tax=mine drainage metagenome TaxID=410659 RepID=A0A1J5RDQ4_9ZZZZ